MGLRNIELLELCEAVSSGVSLGDTLTLGRQWSLVAHHEKIRTLSFIPELLAKLDDVSSESSKWADHLFQILGATSISSIDASSYEGATIIHDMNFPAPKNLESSFDFVFDGGTTEHIFDVAQVFRNVMNFVRVGGHILSCVPANNLMGHGFYQFSPELFYRVYSPENGFEVKRLIVVDADTGRRYEAMDPAKIGRRVELYGTAPRFSMIMLAKKIEAKPPFTNPPVQSDYASHWAGRSLSQKTEYRSFMRRKAVQIGASFLPGVVSWIRYRRAQDLRFHPELFRRID